MTKQPSVKEQAPYSIEAYREAAADGADSMETLSAIGLLDSQYGVEQIHRYIERVADDFHGMQDYDILSSPKACVIKASDPLPLQVAKGLGQAFFSAENSRDQAAALKNLASHYDASRRAYGEATKHLIQAAKVASEIATKFVEGELERSLKASDPALVCQLHAEGISVAEIASVLGLPLQTVISYLPKDVEVIDAQPAMLEVQ